MSEFVASLHPPLVAFPFVLTWVVLSLDIYELVKRDETYSKLSLYLLNFTAVITFIAYQSGHQASQVASQTFVVSDKDIGVHFLWAKIFLFVMIGALVLKWVAFVARFNRRLWQFLAFVFLSSALALVIYVGQLGGELVFEHGAGVRASLAK
jgi:uncharacterized membrane protein